MINLIYNEFIKLSGKRRMGVILLILVTLISIFTYAQLQNAKELEKRVGNVDWRKAMEIRIEGWQSRMNSSRTDPEERTRLQVRIDQNQYYLDKNINPAETGAPTFVRTLLDNAAYLLLPLMMMIVAADMVSSEQSSGTIKVLLTRPIRRWRILLAKYLTLVMSVCFILTSFVLLAALISGSVFGFKGWDAPVLTGFSMAQDQLDTTSVRMMPQWQFILMEIGLAGVVSLTVATISFMLSVLVRSTAAGMGIMLASLIAGLILQGLVASWDSAKYLFMVNLRLINYLVDAAPPVAGMTLGFSLSVLAMWSAGALFVAFRVFMRRDVF